MEIEKNILTMCMVIVEVFKDLPNEIYLKAIDKFRVELEWRKCFLPYLVLGNKHGYIVFKIKLGS